MTDRYVPAIPRTIEDPLAEVAIAVPSVLDPCLTGHCGVVGTVVVVVVVCVVLVVVVAMGIVLIEGTVVVSVIVLFNKEMTLELVTGPNFPDLAILKVSVQLFPVLIVNFDDVNLHEPFTDQVFLPGEFVEATADNAIVCLLLRFVIFHVTRVDEAALTR